MAHEGDADDQRHLLVRVEEGVGIATLNPRYALARIKENLLDAERLGLAEAMEREVPRHQACGGTA
ncbi:hypothetical protein ACFQ07_05245, partial [Actinomadura adrarensis]